MPNLQDFFERTDLLFTLYEEGKYADALAVAEQAAVDFPEMDSRVMFWKICLQNMNGQPAEALQTFKDALARGMWWAESILRSDSDLASLQGNDEFERFVRRSDELKKQAEATAKPELFVKQPEGTGPFPLLIALHPRNGYPEFDLRDWSPAVQLGWVLAIPRSSQLASPLSYVWDDREKAFAEIIGHYESLIEKYPVDRTRVVIGGFSQGAARAIELVMSQKIKARGFYAVVPGVLDMAELEGWAGAHGGRNVFVSGGKDPRYEMFVEIKQIFAKHDLPLMFEHYPEMTHQIPNHFESVLQKGLEFILKENE